MSDDIFIKRCLELASNGMGKVAPNPMVGAVLVYEGKILGEGFHRQFGHTHAEVNAVEDAIHKGYENLLPYSTLFVSLEPCAHHGKTPPCTDLILRYKIPNVIIGCRDSYREVNGKGISSLQKSGVKCGLSSLENECRNINRRFFTYHEKLRPFIILKYAQSKDGFIAPLNSSISKKISNPITDIIVHKWRTEEAAIMIGTNTAVSDNPALTARHYQGKNPVRVVIDKTLRLPKSLKIFDSSAKTIIFNEKKETEELHLKYLMIDFQKDLVTDILRRLYEEQIQSVIVEGGAALLSQFISSGLWDEARIITGQVEFGSGIKAPFFQGKLMEENESSGDKIQIFRPF